MALTINTISLPSCMAKDDVKKDDAATKTEQVKEDKEPDKTPEELKAFETRCSLVDPVDLVEKPADYLDKYVFIKAVFDKYTTLGLDYKPAMRDSKDFISFLIVRPDVKSKKYRIPLSELKLIISRKIAEKYTNLDTGDKIQIYGKVFSTALNDPWLEVDHIVSSTKDITAKPEEDKEFMEDDE